MRCQNPACGRELEDGSAFCRYCGSPVPEEPQVETAQEGAEGSGEGASAEAAPEPQAMFCERCGAPIVPGSAFCERCGAPLSPSDADDGGDWEDMEDWEAPVPTVPAPSDAFAAPAAATGSFGAPASTGAFETPAATGSFAPPASTGAFESPAAATGSFVPPAATGAFEAPASATGSFAAPAATGSFAPQVPATGGKAKGKRGIVIAVAAAVVAVAVGVGAVLLPRGNNGGNDGGGPSVTNPFAPHELTEEKAAELASKEAARIPVTHPSVSRDWIGEQKFVAGEMTVDALHEPSSSASDMWSADLTLAYESDAVAYERSWELTCAWDDSASDWEVYSLDDLGASDPRPTRGITDEELVANAATLLTEAKPAPENTESHSLDLAKCYSNGFAAAVDGNLYDDRSEAVRANVKVTGSHGLGTYRGTLATDLSWAQSSSGGEFGWGVDSCVADADAWHPDYAPLTCGTWRGTFLETSDQGEANCYGGRANPAVMVVKSVDSTAQTMVVDMAFVFHDHGGLKNDQEATEGDTVIDLHDVLITFSPSSYVQSDPVYSGDGFYVYLGFPSDGVEMGFESRTTFRSIADGPWRQGGTDSYKMVRDAPAQDATNQSQQPAADPAQQQAQPAA